MTSHATPSDLYTLTLTDGLPGHLDSRPVRYRQVRLRETTVADERWATQAAERVMWVGSEPKLLVSDDTFKAALTARHIAAFCCPGLADVPGDVIDLELIGKLSPHDWGLIEQRVFLVEMAAELRYGNMSQAEFDALLKGGQPAGAAAPQPVGQVAALGHLVAEPGPGIEMLAMHAGGDAHGPAAGDGR